MITEWWAWWTLLQPPERVFDVNGKANKPLSTMDWTSLAKTGSNGFLLVMLTLTWWGKLKADSEWQRAINDVTAVLRSLTTGLAPSVPRLGKRKAAPLSASDGRILNTPKRAKQSTPAPLVTSPRRLRNHDKPTQVPLV